MKRRALKIDESLRLVPLDPDQAAEAVRDTGARIWFDISYQDDADLVNCLKAFDISELARRICLEMRGRSGFYPLNREVVFSIPARLERSNWDEVHYVTWVCRENLLVTAHREGAVVQQREDLLDYTADWLPSRSIGAIVSATLVRYSLDGLQRTADLRRALRTLEEQMDRQPGQVEMAEILDARSSVLPLAEMVNNWLPVVQSLRDTDKPPFNDHEVRDYINCAVVNLNSANAQLDRMDDRIDALHAGFQMNAQEKTNHRLGVLTILSAIFMPITLLAGIWGMNFDRMPELHLTWSYPVALLTMCAIGSTMYLYFRLKGWFK